MLCHVPPQFLYEVFLELLAVEPLILDRILVGNETVDHSDVVEASPIGAAPTTSSLSTPASTPGFNVLH